MASIEHDRTLERGMGRDGAVPALSAARAWKDLLFRTFREVNDDRVTLVAAGVTYFLLLAIFPSVTAFISIYGLFVDPATVARQLDVLATVVPPGGLAIIRDQLMRITEQGTPTLGMALLISLAVALWSASSGVKSMFEAMNVAYDENERRNFLALNALALVFTLIGVVAAAVMLAAVVAIPAILGVLGLGRGLGWLVQIAGYVVMLLVLVTGLAALYRFGPCRQHARWRWITPGACLAVAVIAVVSVLFSWYAASIGHFDQTYGSLGALIGFLFWMWLCIIATIVGAELNSELEHPTVHDTIARDGAPMSGAATPATLGPSTTGSAAHRPDDPRAGRNGDWIAGSEAASRRRPPGTGPRLPLAAAIPAILVLGVLGLKARAGK